MIANVLRLQERAIAKELRESYYDNDEVKLRRIIRASMDEMLDFTPHNELVWFPYESSTSYGPKNQ